MVKLAYIAGFSYSGSTLLSLMLHAHPEMGTTGEIVGPPHFESNRDFACSCGRLVRECPFYRELEKRIGDPGFDLAGGRWRTRQFSQPPKWQERLLFGSLPVARLEAARDWALWRLPLIRRVAQRIAGLNGRFISAASELLQTGILVDSSKLPHRIGMLRRLSDVDLRVIHLVRHPAGCALSASRYHHHSPRYAAWLWQRNFDLTRRQLSYLPAPSQLRVRYEDLCQEPESIAQSLCGFLGVDYNPRMLRFRSQPHHIIGNRMRLESSEDIRLDEQWRTTWAIGELQEIRRAAARGAQECSYWF